MAINLSRQQPLDTDTKAMWQSNFTGNLKREGYENAKMFFYY